jgi:hypothetical protein
MTLSILLILLTEFVLHGNMTLSFSIFLLETPEM